MRIEPVEIYSNSVMRHPGRRFPGVLIQGDSLHNLCVIADDVCKAVEHGNVELDDVTELRDLLWSYLGHYKVSLEEHEVPLPFSERPKA